MKEILVVGASGGIGRVVAAHFLNVGFNVIGTNYKNDFLKELINNKNFSSFNLDITDLNKLEELSKTISSLDAIINCSGVIEFEAYSDPTENIAIWDRTMAVNVKGSYVLFEKMKEKIKPGGSYVIISSTDAMFGGKVNTAYASSKAGVNSITKSLALMYQDSKVRVNSVAPGWVETAMMEAGGDDLAEFAKSINPLKRNGDPQDVANIIEFLISEKANYINGEIITLDGGYTLQDPTLSFEEEQISKNH